jgi:hypothetical protein
MSENVQSVATDNRNVQDVIERTHAGRPIGSAEVRGGMLLNLVMRYGRGNVCQAIDPHQTVHDILMRQFAANVDAFFLAATRTRNKATAMAYAGRIVRPAEAGTSERELLAMFGLGRCKLARSTRGASLALFETCWIARLE